MTPREKWLKAKENKNNYEFAKYLMTRYVAEYGSKKMIAEFGKNASYISRYIGLGRDKVEVKDPKLYARYMETVSGVKSESRMKQHNKKCSKEWLNIKSRYNDLELAEYLIDYYLKFGNFDEIKKISGSTLKTIRSKYISPLDMQLENKCPEKYIKYLELIKSPFLTKVKASVSSKNGTSKNTLAKIPVRQLIKSLPSKLEYGKFLDTMCHSAVTGDMSTQKLLELAKENGIMIWERMDSGKVKVY